MIPQTSAVDFLRSAWNVLYAGHLDRPFPLYWLLEYLPSQVADRVGVSEETTLSKLLSVCIELDCIDETLGTTVDSLRMHWSDLKPQSKLALIGYIRDHGLAGSFEGLLRLTRDDQ